ncbi:transposase [Siminovitchia sp. FSL H7-0308]|uniref:Transposase IS110-like N-terminal domain-containing protein n=2 Tax=Siminovitchia thermophila TaxID=1245522 RepID=A0ABS2R387_9BACI|nr:transposase [Siminovitchia thermophila]MBM7714116.1 hypothetical protein [Siminovitchia thermophila]ONK24714.1 hypothetical protein BLX87_03455 [Bacillus sp. VT-16-64]
MGLVIALDISMGKSYKVTYDDQTCLSEGEIIHNKEGFQALLAEIQSLPEEPILVFESTGVYSKPVETLCQRNKLRYCVLNPFEARTRNPKKLENGQARCSQTCTSPSTSLPNEKNNNLKLIMNSEIFLVSTKK